MTTTTPRTATALNPTANPEIVPRDVARWPLADQAAFWRARIVWLDSSPRTEPEETSFATRRLADVLSLQVIGLETTSQRGYELLDSAVQPGVEAVRRRELVHQARLVLGHADSIVMTTAQRVAKGGAA